MYNVGLILDLANVIASICEWAFIKSKSLQQDRQRYMWLVDLEEEAQSNRPQCELEVEDEDDSVERFGLFLVGLITYTAVVRWVTDHRKDLVAKDKRLKDNYGPIIEELMTVMLPIVASLAAESDLLEGFDEFHYDYWYEHVGQFK